jgi:hypothetical protein
MDSVKHCLLSTLKVPEQAEINILGEARIATTCPSVMGTIPMPMATEQSTTGTDRPVSTIHAHRW